jgi:hypothetical protein
LLQRACNEFEGLGDLIGAAECLQNLGDTGSKRDEDARDSLQQARNEFEQMGDRDGAL